MGILRMLKAGGDAPPLGDREAVTRLFRRSRASVIASITMGYGFAYTCRLGLSVVKKPLIDAGIFSAGELGTIGAAFLYGYGLGMFVNGPLADKANVRRFFPLGLALSAVINALMGSTTLFWVAATAWAVNGWFQGFLAPSSAVAITQWFTKRERGTVYGIWSSSHAIGEGLNFVFTAALVSATAWQAAFFGPAVLCLITAFALTVTLRDRPQTYGLPSVEKWKQAVPFTTEGPAQTNWGHSPRAAPQTKVGIRVRRILGRPAIWILGISSACMYMTRYAVNSWGVLYLQETRGFGLVEAGSYIGLAAVAGVVGSPLYGYISDRFFDSRRPPVTLLFGMVEVSALGLIFFGPAESQLCLYLGFLLYGFTLSGLLACLGGLFAVDLVPRRRAGAAMGIVGLFSYLGAGAQELISGGLIQSHAVRLADGSWSYDFGPAVQLWFGASVLSLVLAATLWSARPTD